MRASLARKTTLAFGIAVASLGIAVSASAQADKVELCHATGSATNPYVLIPPSASGAYHGHYSHHGRDIIPPFTYQGTTYSLNWGDADARAIFANGCRPLAPEEPEEPEDREPPEVGPEPPIVNPPPFTG